MLFVRACLSSVRVRRHVPAALAVLAGVSPLLAQAEEAAPRLFDKWYVGAQSAHLTGGTTEAEFNARLAEAGYDVTATFADRTRTAWRGVIGYQWTQRFALQLGYTDLGDIDSTLSGLVVDLDAFLADVDRLHPRSADGVEFSIVGRQPLTSRLTLFGRAGVFGWESKYRATNLDARSDRRREEGADLILGAGLEFALVGRIGLTADWSRYSVAGESIDLAGLGLVWRL